MWKGSESADLGAEINDRTFELEFVKLGTSPQQY